MKKRRKQRKIFSKNTDDEISLVCAPVEKKRADIKPAGSFCSLVKSFCKSENCGNCKALQDHAPGHMWLCTKCVNPVLHITYPFWEDVACSICGINYGVMVCAKNRKKRYPTT